MMSLTSMKRRRPSVGDGSKVEMPVESRGRVVLCMRGEGAHASYVGRLHSAAQGVPKEMRAEPAAPPVVAHSEARKDHEGDGMSRPTLDNTGRRAGVFDMTNDECIKPDHIVAAYGHVGSRGALLAGFLFRRQGERDRRLRSGAKSWIGPERISGDHRLQFGDEFVFAGYVENALLIHADPAIKQDQHLDDDAPVFIGTCIGVAEQSGRFRGRPASL